MAITGAQMTERIRFYRFRSLSLVIAILGPLVCGNILALFMLFTAIGQGRAWIFSKLEGISPPLAIAAAAGVLALTAWLVASRVRSRIRRNLKDLYREGSYDRAAYETFVEALSSVCIGLGISAPPLDVLGIPTVNSIAFMESKEPRIGITAEALTAGLSQHEKEALMAHEAAHVVLGDLFLASKSAAFEYAGYGCGLLLLLFSALLFFAVNVYLPLFLLPLFAPLAVVLADRKLTEKKRDLYRCNDLLADTIAAKVVSDPASLRRAIQKLWDLSETTKAVIPRTAHFQDYLFLRRPLASGPVKMVTYSEAWTEKEAEAPGRRGSSRATKIYWVPGKGRKSKTWLAYEAVQDRIRNLEAIESGLWSELERPRLRQKAHAVAAVVLAGALTAASALAPLIPWQGKTLWHHATANALWKMFF